VVLIKLTSEIGRTKGPKLEMNWSCQKLCN